MKTRLAWWQTLLAVMSGLAVAVIGASVVGAVLAFVSIALKGGGAAEMMDQARLSREVMSLPIFGTTLVVTALGFVGSATLAPYLAKLPVKQTLGLNRAHPAAFVAAAVGTLALGPTCDLFVRLSKDVLPSIEMGSLEMLEMITRSHPFLALFPFIALCPGIGEEIFFRGLIQRSIPWPSIAIVVSAVSFSMIHMDPQHVVGVLPLAFFLAWVAYRTDSTSVTIVAHITNNTAALAAAQLIPADEAEGSMKETLTLMPIGWVIALAAIWVIVYVSRRAPETTAAAPVVASAPDDTARERDEGVGVDGLHEETGSAERLQ